ncbi:hypothetical protein PR048_008934 [Dryococelus australis]|uniref:Uncharacterized protein n=1 Tax=Dryococelus australis TaxID=614101 RepID=A0ABQ9HZJ9_9NEOP|nr:hypothetical protein PR048_008934 [Dryococelus australis]
MLWTETNTTAALDDKEFGERKVLKASDVYDSAIDILTEEGKSIGNVTVADDIITKTEFTFSTDLE